MPCMAMAAGAAVGRGGGGTDEYDGDEDHGLTGPDVEKASSAAMAMSSSPKKGFVDSTGGRLTIVGPDCLSLLLVVVLLLFRLPFMMLGILPGCHSLCVIMMCFIILGR